MKSVDTCFFPGWTRKSVTFTIDDGNLTWDGKFLDIVKPYGILGTFNLCNTDAASPEEYRAFYRGYEIANHCLNHAIIFRDGFPYKFTDAPFDPMESSVEYVYKTDVPGLYKMHYTLYLTDKTRYPKPGGWHPITDAAHYMEYADETKVILEKVFGEGSVRGFVWPHGKQVCPEVTAHLKAMGYDSIRKTGCIEDSTGFAMPTDRWDWTYNANNTNLLSVMEKYEAFPDDGNLKFFSFGVHSVDFERGNNWDDLKAFAKTYGNRPETYYYAGVSDIFAYEDALAALEISEEKIHNPSQITLYIKVGGARILLPPKSSFVF